MVKGVPEEADWSSRPGDAFDAKLRRDFPEIGWDAFDWSRRNASVDAASMGSPRLIGLPTASGVHAPRFWGLAAHTAPARSLTVDHLIPLGVKHVPVYVGCEYCRYHEAETPGLRCGDLPSLPGMASGLLVPVDDLGDVRAFERRVLDAARQTDGFEEADILLCQFPPALCSAFLTHTEESGGTLRTYREKHLVIELAWRHDMQRQGDAACAWAEQFAAILRARPKHLVVAHTAFDVAYVHHFTGLGRHVNLIEYTSSRWLAAGDAVPRSAQHVNAKVLVLPDRRTYRGDPDWSLRRVIRTVLAEAGIEAGTARELYGSYRPEQLIQHRAVVAVPYSAYSFQLADWYWLGMSLFVPTPRLLGYWHYHTGVVYELIQERFGGDGYPMGPCTGCAAPGWNASESGHAWAPQDVRSHPKTAEYWFSLFWIYSVPHVKYFAGLWELIEQLKDYSAADARRLGRLVRRRNARVLRAARHQWQVLLAALLAT